MSLSNNPISRTMDALGRPLGKAAEGALSPYLRLGATALAAGRGTVNLANGDMAAERRAQTVDLTKPEYLRPVQDAKGVMQVGAGLAAGIAGAEALTAGKGVVDLTARAANPDRAYGAAELSDPSFRIMADEMRSAASELASAGRGEAAARIMARLGEIIGNMGR